MYYRNRNHNKANKKKLLRENYVKIKEKKKEKERVSKTEIRLGSHLCVSKVLTSYNVRLRTISLIK